ncbi:putative trp repressor [Haemophilus haemolyticus M21639]|nr:putative trp repressor [Haemophilus haemolyticus M21639]
MYISRNLEQWNAFLQMLKTAFEENKAQEFLTLLLTADERDAVGLRLQIVSQLIDKNMPQREIQQNLNTSAATITRGSNMIKTMEPDFMQWMKQHIDLIKKTKRIFTALSHLFSPKWWKKNWQRVVFRFFSPFLLCCCFFAFYLFHFPLIWYNKKSLIFYKAIFDTKFNMTGSA